MQFKKMLMQMILIESIDGES